MVASTRAMSITRQKIVPSCIGTYIIRATIKHLGIIKNVKTKIHMIQKEAMRCSCELNIKVTLDRTKLNNCSNTILKVKMIDANIMILKIFTIIFKNTNKHYDIDI